LRLPGGCPQAFLHGQAQPFEPQYPPSIWHAAFHFGADLIIQALVQLGQFIGKYRQSRSPTNDRTIDSAEIEAGKQARPIHRATSMRSDITLVKRQAPEGPGPPSQTSGSLLRVNMNAAEFAARFGEPDFHRRVT
jgi:hypothetical protein